MTAISCIIPAYNEEDNISRVLSVVQDYPHFNEIIVIDDGSNDQTCKIVTEFQKITPRIKLIVNPQNLGKSGAINKAVQSSHGDLIVMIDADLISLNHDNITELIRPVIKNKYGLTILDRAGDRKAIWGWTNCARFFGGERAIWKKDYLEMQIPNCSGYLLESKMNLHFINQNKKVKTIYCDNLYTVHQYNKVSLLQGYQNYLKMSKQIVKDATAKGFLTMALKIEEDRIQLLYDFYNKISLLAPFVILTGLTYGTLTCINLNVTNIIEIPEKWIDNYKSMVENISRFIKF
jgi:glycosyltransferase involved in cell wall biosynthesis